METQTLLTETIRLPHAEVSERKLLIDTTASDADLMGITRRLMAVAGYAQWALATALDALLTRKGETWLNDFCITCEIHPKLRRELLAVHAFYPAPKRALDLSYHHYRDAMLIVNDGKPKALDRALACLTTAHNNGWSVGELRRHSRQATRTEQQTPTNGIQQDFGAYECVHDFARYAHQELPRLATWSAERVELVLTDLGDAVAFVEQLKRLQAHYAAPHRGKESFKIRRG